MKLKSLIVKNYKSIRNLKLELSDGLNVFVGPTDSGKSNIIRAIRDLVFNASGPDFITHGENKSGVRINDVMWYKSDKRNEYRIGDQIYSNVGRKSPDEVKEHLKIKEIQWDHTSSKKINFIEQFENKFFLCYQDSLNAKILSKVSGIQRIFTAQKSVLNDKRSNESEIKHITKDIEEDKDSLELYIGLEGIGLILEEIKEDINEIDNIESDLDMFVKLRKDYHRIKSEFIEHSESIKEVEIDDSSIDELYLLRDQYKDFIEKRSLIEDSTSRIKSMESDIEELENELKRNIEMFNEFIETNSICPLTKASYYESCKKDIVSNG